MVSKKKLLGLAIVVLGVGAFTGCRHQEPNFVYMPDMAYSPAIKAQKEGSMMKPVEGTVPRDYTFYPYRKDPDAAGKNLHNPLKPTMVVLQRGQTLFNTYCIVCHGPRGMGDGYVVPPFPRPPSLQSDKVRNWPDGRIYHVITVGQNLMPSYASQVSSEDRWAIIHYIRAIQRAEHPTKADLEKAKE